MKGVSAITIIRYISVSLSFALIAFANIGGCGGTETNYRGVFTNYEFCSPSKDNCDRLRDARDCKSSRFIEDGGDMCANPDNPSICKLNRCCLSGACRTTSTSSVDSISSRDNSLILLHLEQGCDVIAKGSFSPDREIECENLALDYECVDYEYIPEIDGENIFNQCWLYECNDCLLELPIIDEEFVE